MDGKIEKDLSDKALYKVSNGEYKHVATVNGIYIECSKIYIYIYTQIYMNIQTYIYVK